MNDRFVEYSANLTTLMDKDSIKTAMNIPAIPVNVKLAYSMGIFKHKRLYKTEPPFQSHSVELIWYVDKAKTHSLQKEFVWGKIS